MELHTVIFSDHTAWFNKSNISQTEFWLIGTGPLVGDGYKYAVCFLDPWELTQMMGY